VTAAGLLLIAGSSWTLGTIALARTEWPDLRTCEQASLRLLAGLGLTALLCSLLTLAGGFGLLTYLLGALAAVGIILTLKNSQRSLRLHNQPSHSATWQVAAVIVILAALAACLGAVAPVTDDDALAYVVPIAQHIARTGHLTVWPDQARSMWPQSQQMLLAVLIKLGSHQLGALTAFEFLLGLSALAAPRPRRNSNAVNAPS